jgi:hypothetical protein
MFEEYIQPYLFKIIDEAKRDGLYTIKHTDGNIMPILNQLVECRPHGLHSIDPMADVDIKGASFFTSVYKIDINVLCTLPLSAVGGVKVRAPCRRLKPAITKRIFHIGYPLCHL